MTESLAYVTINLRKVIIDQFYSSRTRFGKADFGWYGEISFTKSGMPIEIGGLLIFLPRNEFCLIGKVWQSG